VDITANDTQSWRNRGQAALADCYLG
jgi:hypothetical protein